jgi:hypothetical protein
MTPPKDNFLVTNSKNNEMDDMPDNSKEHF